MFIKQLDALSTKDLRAVTILADVRNFHRAAKLCSVSQPALSTIIKKVEEVLDVQLFKRSSRSFEITQTGHMVVDKIRQALGMLSEISSKSIPKLPLEGGFRLGFIPTIGPYYIPRLIRPLLKRFPKLELSFTEATTPMLTEMLVRREIDAAVVALPLHHPRIVEEALFQEELVLAVSSGHPLSRTEKVAISEVKQKELLLMEQGHCLRGNAIESCRHDIKNARTVHSTSLETLLFMVQAEVGYTIVPEMAAVTNKKTIKYVRFRRPAPTRTVGLAYLDVNPLQQDVLTLIDFLKTCSKR